MVARRRIPALLLALPLLGGLAAPAARAANGGATPGVIVLPGPPQTIVRLGNPLLNASANGIALHVRAAAMARGRMRLTGHAPAGLAGGAVRIERLDIHLGWVAVATVPVAADGAFAATWRPRRAGALQLRAVPDTSASADAGAAGAGPQLSVTVYSPGVASWYGGPGFAGTRTACGVTLGPTTLGVAHRTLPCGTPVAFYYRGRTVVVPVIDHGPFVAGRTWDLTRAAFDALGGGADGLLALGALPVTPAR